MFDSVSDLVNGFLILTEENRPIEAIMSAAYALHKAPVAYYSCEKMSLDYALFVNAYNTFVLSPGETWGPYLVSVMWNVFFNWVDLMYEAIFLVEVNEQREWTTIGEYLAKIISDILFKSPITPSWNYRNSDVLNEEWGEPINLVDGSIREINLILVEFGLDPIFTDEAQRESEV